MKYSRMILSVLAMACWATAVQGQPNIAGVSGNLIEGEHLQIVGQGFGTKEIAGPILFDDFQNGSEGAELAGPPGSPWLLDDDMGGLYLPRYSSGQQRLGGDMSCLQSFGPRDGGFQNNCRFGLDDARLTQVYFSGWLYWENTAPSTEDVPLSVRLFEHGGSQEPGLGCWRAYPQSGAQYGALTSLPCAVGEIQNTQYGFGLPSAETWHRVEIWRSFGADLDAEVFNLRVDGDDKTQWAAGGPGCDLSTVTLVSWFGAPDERAAMNFYWSEVYLDNTRARVEIGNAAVFEDCSHREVQIPEAWSDGEVAVQVRGGAFVEGETLYLFVVDEQGQVSAGHAVSWDLGPPGPPVIKGLGLQN